MATPPTIWIRGAGAQNDKNGTSLLHAYGLDPNAANDGWTAINALGALTQDLEVKICGGGAIGATINITKDATPEHRITVQGRNVGDTADAEVDADADGGAFPVFTLTTATYWALRLLHATNTNGLSSNHGFSVTSGSTRVVVDHCHASLCANGISFASNAYKAELIGCRAHDNAVDGFVGEPGTSFLECVAHDNGRFGFFVGRVIRCLAYGNTGDGFYKPILPVACTAHNNGGSGFRLGDVTAPWINCVDCLAVNNGDYGYKADAATVATSLLRCGSFNNTPGRNNTGTGTWRDIDPVILTADPFVNAGAGDFALNGSPGGRACQNRAGILLPGGLSRSFQSIGAIQTPLSAGPIGRRLARLYMSMRS